VTGAVTFNDRILIYLFKPKKMKTFIENAAFIEFIQQNGFTLKFSELNTDKPVEDENQIELDNNKMTLLVTKWTGDTSVHISKKYLKVDSASKEAEFLKNRIIEIFNDFYGEIN
jgi:hypothetical protein